MCRSHPSRAQAPNVADDGVSKSVHDGLMALTKDVGKLSAAQARTEAQQEAMTGKLDEVAKSVSAIASNVESSKKKGLLLLLGFGGTGGIAGGSPLDAAKSYFS